MLSRRLIIVVLTGLFLIQQLIVVRALAQSSAEARFNRAAWLADYSALANCNDVEFTERLINEARVAVIPLSPFYRDPPANMRVVRLCVAKRDETLEEAARRICQYTSGASSRRSAS